MRKEKGNRGSGEASRGQGKPEARRVRCRARGPSTAAVAKRGAMGVIARGHAEARRGASAAGQAGRATGMAGTPDASSHALATGDRLLLQPRGPSLPPARNFAAEGPLRPI